MQAWRDVQHRIWTCEACRSHERVACNVRQQTDKPDRDVKLLLVGVAPPYVSHVVEKTVARSATNNHADNLRATFILATLGLSWDELLARGFFLLHSVKCAIVPKDQHQNPPRDVVDQCVPNHFGAELNMIRPRRMVLLGAAPFRAILKTPGINCPKGLGLSTRVRDLVERSRGGIELSGQEWKSWLHVAPFPLQGRKLNPLAADILREAAELSGIITPAD